MALSKSTSNSVPGVQVTTWTFDADGNGAAETFDGCDTITVQEIGNDGGGTVTIECSNDGTTFVAIPTAISLSAAGVESVAADSLGFRYYRPVLSGATDPDVSIILVGTRNALVRP